MKRNAEEKNYPELNYTSEVSDWIKSENGGVDPALEAIKAGRFDGQIEALRANLARLDWRTASQLLADIHALVAEALNDPPRPGVAASLFAREDAEIYRAESEYSHSNGAHGMDWLED